MKSSDKCYIFSGAPDASFPEKTDYSDGFIYCADGGYKYAEKFNIIPDVLIGDFDTCPEALKSDFYAEKYNTKKDETDTMLAVMDAIDKGFEEINIFAALGGRFDHTIANVQTLSYILKSGRKGYIYDKNNIVTMQGKGKTEYFQREGYYFSIFAYSEVVKNLTITGAEYNTEKLDLYQTFPLGVSNRIVDEYCSVEFDDGILLVVFSKD